MKEEERGRFLLRALLWLTFLCALAGGGLSLVPLDRERMVLLGASLLPLAVVLWGIHRGSLPALILLVLAAIQELGGLTDLLRYGGPDAFQEPQVLAALVLLLLRVLVLGAAWTPSAASGYLAGRRQARTRWDLVLEVVLYLCALVLSAAPWAWGILMG